MSENKNISLDTSRGTFFYFLLCTAAAIVFLFPVGIANMVFGYILGDSPCTLCWGQRIAMIFIALCAFFIVRYGFKPKYIASLLIFTGVGLWQSFRHIAPHSARDLDQGFGLMVLGAHTYFWAEVVFWAVIILLGVMFFFAPKVLIAFRLLFRRDFLPTMVRVIRFGSLGIRNILFIPAQEWTDISKPSVSWVSEM